MAHEGVHKILSRTGIIKDTGKTVSNYGINLIKVKFYLVPPSSDFTFYYMIENSDLHTEFKKNQTKAHTINVCMFRFLENGSREIINLSHPPYNIGLFNNEAEGDYGCSPIFYHSKTDSEIKLLKANIGGNEYVPISLAYHPDQHEPNEVFSLTETYFQIKNNRDEDEIKEYISNAQNRVLIGTDKPLKTVSRINYIQELDLKSEGKDEKRFYAKVS